MSNGQRMVQIQIHRLKTVNQTRNLSNRIIVGLEEEYAIRCHPNPPNDLHDGNVFNRISNYSGEGSELEECGRDSDDGP